MHQEFISHADTSVCGNEFHKNSTIVELPNGDLLAAWMAGKEGEGARDQDVYGARRAAGEDDWGDDFPLTRVGGRSVGCPILFMGPGEELWLTSPQMYGDWLTGSRLMYKRSPDLGESWYDLEILHEKPGLYLKNKPLYLENEERWLLGTDTYAIESKPHFLVIGETYSDRPGDFPTLVGGEEIAPRDTDQYIEGHQPLIYPTAVERADGSLLAFMRPNPPKTDDSYLWKTESFDRGYNWTKATETAIPNPNAGFDLLTTQEGNILLIVNPTQARFPPEGRNKLALFMSEDGAQTWPYQYLLEYEGADGPLIDIPDGERPEFTYGNIIQSEDGTIHLTYECRRRGIKHVELTEDEIRQNEKDPIIAEIAS